jgi:hypothetical protein
MLIHHLRKERKLVRRKRKDQNLQTAPISLKATNHWISEWTENESSRRTVT